MWTQEAAAEIKATEIVDILDEYLRMRDAKAGPLSLNVARMALSEKIKQAILGD